MHPMHESASNQPHRLYRDLADWYPMLTPLGDYAEEDAFYRHLFEARCWRPPRTLLDLGSGGGHHAAHLKAALALLDRLAQESEMHRRYSDCCTFELFVARRMR